jgi:hypothetical protein
MPKICTKYGINLIKVGSSSTVESVLSEYELSFFHRALRSTVANHYGTSQVEVDDIDKEFYELQFRSFSLSLCLISSLITNQRYQIIATVNGRGVIDGSAVLACQNANARYELIEMTSENWSYYSFQELNTQSVQEIQK